MPEITELKKENDFFRDKIDRLESYIFILKAHISDGNPPPPPEKKWGITKDGKIVDIN